jgi:CubicO group peptidase (beta-lactamase class C family)
MFFFEKKNQKTFIHGAEQTDESLFASFSTEKEDSCLLSRRALLVAALAAPSAAQAQRAPTPESLGFSSQRLAQATGVLEAAVGEGRLNGAVFGLMRQGRQAWLRAVGFRDTAQAQALRPDAIFPLGALTRPLASVAAMVLVERGRLKLADPVSAYLPALREVRVAIEKRDAQGGVELAFERARRAITIQDLLRHTAGFTLAGDTPVGRLYAEAGVQAPGRTLAESVEALAALPLAHQPGTVWADSLATDVLARVVELVSGQAFDRFLAREVTGPLRMADTGFAVPAKDQARIAQPRTDPLTGAVPPGPDLAAAPRHIGGAEGLCGTASDYLRFGQALLAGGALDNARVLGAGTVAHMTRDHLGTIARDSPSGLRLLGEGNGFGLGVAVRLAGGVHPLPGSAGDFGLAGAFGGQFLVDPARELVAVLLANQANQFDHLFPLFRTLVHQTLTR